MWKINKKEIKIRRGREVQQKIQKSISGGGGGGGGGWGGGRGGLLFGTGEYVISRHKNKIIWHYKHLKMYDAEADLKLLQHPRSSILL